MSDASWYRWQDDALTLSMRVQPKSSRNDLAGIGDDLLKVRITAPPVDGQANTHLIRLLAKWFGVSRSKVTLVRGDTGRMKQIRIESPRAFPDDSLFEAVQADRPKA